MASGGGKLAAVESGQTPYASDDRGAPLSERFEAVRRLTETLAEPLSPEDQCIQSMPLASPTKWHRAHTSWFFETFLLEPHAPGYRPFNEAFAYLFNSYYQAIGPQHPQPNRGMISRPNASEVRDYRRYVDEAMLELLGDSAEELAELVELGLNHEQQHQELLLMDIKHVLSQNPLMPAYRDGSVDGMSAGVNSSISSNAAGSGDAADTDNTVFNWCRYPAGLVEVGLEPQELAATGRPEFYFDNETPLHQHHLEPFELADRAVTCGQWLEFIAEGGYGTCELWLSDGWNRVNEEGWHAPLYWRQVDGEWFEFTLDGRRPLNLDAPVCHVNYYEADAFARWAGARLPTEAEWEHAAKCLTELGQEQDSVSVSTSSTPQGNFLNSGLLAPAPPPATDTASDSTTAPQPRQLFGDVWEWTASPYTAYPGFAPGSGAIGEYNGKFMINQQVLRGGCCATPAGHIRATYRNFFYPHTRWHFSGLRLARDSG